VKYDLKRVHRAMGIVEQTRAKHLKAATEALQKIEGKLDAATGRDKQKLETTAALLEDTVARLKFGGSD